MPELPDVEGFRRVLAAHALRWPIREVDVLDTGVLRGISERESGEALRGQRLGTRGATALPRHAQLQGLRLARDEGDIDRVLDDLGPDAPDLSRQDLHDVLAARRGQDKTALTDQSLIAGLGNLLADEILWRARVHPRSRCAGLGSGEVGRLHSAMGTVLRQSVKAGRVPPGPS
jgi:formamidopyrimidine-DNA glycosylase